jgi:hypothetical protein
MYACMYHMHGKNWQSFFLACDMMNHLELHAQINKLEDQGRNEIVEII